MASSLGDAPKGKGESTASEKRTWTGVKVIDVKGSVGQRPNIRGIEKESKFGATEANVGLAAHIHTRNMYGTEERVGRGWGANSMEHVRGAGI